MNPGSFQFWIDCNGGVLIKCPDPFCPWVLPLHIWDETVESLALIAAKHVTEEHDV